MAERKTEKFLKPDGINITAIIVNYFLKFLLPNLLFILEKEECIADNRSAEDLEEIVTNFPKVRIKKFDHNSGFGVAINWAAVVSPSYYFPVIKPDTLQESGSVADFLECASQTYNLRAVPA